MSDKPKNDKFKNDAPRFNTILFLALWIAGHIGAWMLAVGVNKFLSWQKIYIHGDFQFIMLMALGTGIPSSIVQLLMVEHGLKKSMRGWLPVSVAGWGLSGLTFYWLWDVMRDILFGPSQLLIDLLPHMLFVPLFVPVAIVQWFYLRRKVKSASLWILASLVSALLFSLSRENHPYSFASWWYVGYGALAAAALFYSGATGATMFYLQTQSHEKAKNDRSEQADVDEAERLARLSDGIDDHQTGMSDLPDSSNIAKAIM